MLGDALDHLADLQRESKIRHLALTVKGLTIMVNSIYNGWRFQDVWLDKLN